MQDSFQSADDLDLEGLPEMWQGMDTLWQRVLELRDPPADLRFSARRFDLAQTAGHRVYIGADRHLQCAMDNHRALLGLLTAHGATPWAPWNLLRPSLEAAVLAAWVLDSNDGLTRRTRGLQLELIDNAERSKYWRELEFLPGSTGKEVARQMAEAQARIVPIYRAEAEDLRVSYERLSHSNLAIRDIIGQLGYMRSDKSFAALARATWRSLSGFQHGHGYALLTGSDMTVVAPTQGGQVAHLVINDERFVTCATVVAHFMTEAMHLWVRRSTQI